MMLDDVQVYLPEVWSNHARCHPGKLAVVCGRGRQTWAQFNASLNRVANRLRSSGIGRGDRVAVLMGNSVATLHAMFGIVKAGACVVPLSTLLTPAQVATLLNDSGAVGLFATPATRALADAALESCPRVRGDLSVLMAGPFGEDCVGETGRGRWQGFLDWIMAVPDTDPPVRYRMEDEFNIIYSSGTTGLPKGIVQTHRARQHWSYSNALEMRFDNRAVALATTSLYSNGTMFMVLPPLFVGATIIILEGFSVEAFFAAVAQERVTHTFMVPTQYIGILEHPQLAQQDLSSLRVMVSAGSPLRDDTKAKVLEKLGPGLFELYGFSEGFATIIKPEDVARKPGSVGKPVVGFELRILGENGEVLGAGQPGEIAGYGGGLMTGYHEKPEATSESVWRDERGRTFLRSGDIGQLDDEGFLYILDRKKDMILSGGFNVFPKDIEAIVALHPAVLDVAVIGVPHPKWGEVPLALVIPRPGTAADPADIQAFANGQLSKTQRLQGVELREDLPRNALGKVLKRVLREPYWKVANG